MKYLVNFKVFKLGFYFQKLPGVDIGCRESYMAEPLTHTHTQTLVQVCFRRSPDDPSVFSTRVEGHCYSGKW